MKVLNKRPTTGQYVMIWEYNGRLWADTHKITKKGKLKRYYPDGKDNFVVVDRMELDWIKQLPEETTKFLVK